MARTPRSELLIARFVRRLTAAIEREIDARARALVGEQLPAALAAREPASPPTNESRAGVSRPHELRPPRERRAPASRRQPAEPPQPDPEQQRRDAELARLRMLLRPGGHEPEAAVPRTVTPPVRAETRDPLRLLEDEIRDEVPNLGSLPQDACRARIAAWSGRARMLDEASSNRIGAELLLDKLRGLARAMEVGHIEALVASWRPREWSTYIRRNEALARTQTTPAPTEAPTAAATDEDADGRE